MIDKGRASGLKRGRSGAPRGNINARVVSAELAQRILEAYNSGNTSEARVARRFGVSPMTVHNVRHFPERYLCR